MGKATGAAVAAGAAAALGVGGLAVALALQDTLSNLFSGFYITLAGQIRVGDYIKLDSGEEGYVTGDKARHLGQAVEIVTPLGRHGGRIVEIALVEFFDERRVAAEVQGAVEQLVHRGHGHPLEGIVFL